MAEHRVVYNAHPTLQKFHASDAFYRGTRGPVGSGKSTAMCMEIMRRAKEQVAGPDSIRRTRFAVIRNTYRELKDTTLKTWLAWFPESYFGVFNNGDMIHNVKFDDVEMEVMFRALDRPQDVKKVLSLELTGAWINEAREVPKGIIDAIGDRVGRYPAVKDGGCTWRGVIMDTNPGDTDHWWYRLAEEDRPEGWNFFAQPGGLTEVGERDFQDNAEAENLENLEEGYYGTRSAGKDADYVRVYYCAQYGFVKDGKPVYPEFRDALHCREIAPDPDLPLFVGLDFGLTPAAVFAQRTVSGQWRWIDELVTEDMGTVRFGEILGIKLRNEYAGFDTEIYGDPSGDSRAQTDETTPFSILQTQKILAKPAPSNDYTLRREAVAVPLSRLIDGEPGLIISPKCNVTRKGMAGGYCYRRVQVVGDERFHDKPDKNRFSHPCEAGQYLMLGAGEGRTLIKKNPERRQRNQKAVEKYHKQMAASIV